MVLGLFMHVCVAVLSNVCLCMRLHVCFIRLHEHYFCQVEDGFKLLASTQGMETTLGLYQAHARDILQEMKVGVAIT